MSSLGKENSKNKPSHSELVGSAKKPPPGGASKVYIKQEKGLPIPKAITEAPQRKNSTLALRDHKRKPGRNQKAAKLSGKVQKAVKKEGAGKKYASVPSKPKKKSGLKAKPKCQCGGRPCKYKYIFDYVKKKQNLDYSHKDGEYTVRNAQRRLRVYHFAHECDNNIPLTPSPICVQAFAHNKFPSRRYLDDANEKEQAFDSEEDTDREDDI